MEFIANLGDFLGSINESLPPSISDRSSREVLAFIEDMVNGVEVEVVELGADRAGSRDITVHTLNDVHMISLTSLTNSDLNFLRDMEEEVDSAAFTKWVIEKYGLD